MDFSTIAFNLFFFLSLISAVSLRRSVAQDNGGVAVELWCVAKNNAEDSALQSALDWACGVGGADCGPIQQGRPCYDAADIRRTASFAFNDYFLRHGMTDDACNFDGSAALTSLNPSYNNCKFPSSMAVKNGRSSNGSAIMGLGPTGAADTSGWGDSSFVAVRWDTWALILFPLILSFNVD